jgi:hypothetical protein
VAIQTLNDSIEDPVVGSLFEDVGFAASRNEHGDKIVPIMMARTDEQEGS